MKIIEFEIYYNSKKIFSTDYIYLEDDSSLYFYNLILNQENINIKTGEKILLLGFIHNINGEKIYISEYEILLKKHLKCNQNINCLLIDGEIDFSDVNYDYDQDLIDLFYFWYKGNDLYDSIRKNQYVYTLATLLYSGIPTKISNFKTIEINGSIIETKYSLFNKLAEELIGNRGYIGNGLDSLADSFKESKLDKKTNKNVINISNYKNLAERFNIYNKNYLDKIIIILEEFGFHVNKL